MNVDDLDHAHGYLIGEVVPLLLARPSSSPSTSVRLRGIVRSGDETTRISVSGDRDFANGQAVEIHLQDLYEDSMLGPVDDVVSFVRNELLNGSGTASLGSIDQIDSHGNVIHPMPEIWNRHQDAHVEQNLFRLFSLMHRGPILESVEGVFAFSGFMLQPGERCRLYCRMVRTRNSYGFEIPLRRRRDGSPTGISTSLRQELTAKLGSQGRLFDPVLAEADDYCDHVYDLTDWLDPRGHT